MSMCREKTIPKETEANRDVTGEGVVATSQTSRGSTLQTENQLIDSTISSKLLRRSVSVSLPPVTHWGCLR
jgi:hypothetical protein